MSDEQQHYISYLLRLWEEPVTRPGAWRASLENSQSGELRGFADVAQLFTFLEQRLADTTANARTHPVADPPVTAVQKGVVLPATEDNRGQLVAGAPTTGNPTAGD